MRRAKPAVVSGSASLRLLAGRPLVIRGAIRWVAVRGSCKRRGAQMGVQRVNTTGHWQRRRRMGDGSSRPSRPTAALPSAHWLEPQSAAVTPTGRQRNDRTTAPVQEFPAIASCHCAPRLHRWHRGTSHHAALPSHVLAWRLTAMNVSADHGTVVGEAVNAEEKRLLFSHHHVHNQSPSSFTPEQLCAWRLAVCPWHWARRSCCGRIGAKTVSVLFLRPCN